MNSEPGNSETGSRFSIETASWRDLNPVRKLEGVCFPKDAWPIWDLAGALTLPNVIRLKAVVAGELVGFIALDVRSAERLAWVATVGVLPEFRGQGIGSALMLAGEKQLSVPRVRLTVRASNESAIRLYESLGYQRVESWPRYYTDGENAVVMEKVL